MKYNIILHERILELSEFKSKHERLKRFVSNWKHVAWLSVGLFTVKVGIEQIIMLIVRGGK